MPFLFTDRHAYLVAAEFYSDLERLDQIEWEMLRRRGFRTDHEDPSKKEKYQAEALIYKHLPVDGLLGLVSYSDEVKVSINQALNKRAMTIEVKKKPDWYL
ncbi:MAG: DarT ssDNA thymidine ADP-ribosyltransferase family protein [Methylocella sp.]